MSYLNIICAERGLGFFLMAYVLLNIDPDNLVYLEAVVLPVQDEGYLPYHNGFYSPKLIKFYEQFGFERETWKMTADGSDYHHLFESGIEEYPMQMTGVWDKKLTNHRGVLTFVKRKIKKRKQK